MSVAIDALTLLMLLSCSCSPRSALTVDDKRVAVVRVLADERKVCVVFVREVEVGHVEHVRREGLDVGRDVRLAEQHRHKLS